MLLSFWYSFKASIFDSELQCLLFASLNAFKQDDSLKTGPFAAASHLPLTFFVWGSLFVCVCLSVCMRIIFIIRFQVMVSWHVCRANQNPRCRWILFLSEDQAYTVYLCVFRRCCAVCGDTWSACWKASPRPFVIPQVCCTLWVQSRWVFPLFS